MSKGLLSVVTGNTPGIRGAVVDQVLRLSPEATVLAVSVEGREDGGYPVVQRFLSGTGTSARESSPQGVTGDPVVVLRQDLLALRRAPGPGRTHVVLALPATVEVIPFLAELWRARVASGPLTDFYDPAPVVVGVDPATFMADLGCVHRSVRLWNGRGLGEPLTTAEAAARQVESADAVVVRAMSTGDGRKASGVAALIGHLNGEALVVTSPGGDAPAPASLAEATPSGTAHAWQARLEPVLAPRSPRVGRHGVESVLWRSRRPLHPGRLADALDAVMDGVVRGRGHLWLCSSPDAVVTWHSAGAYLELREADGWLEAHDRTAWEAASPQRRTLASWFWHDYYGERRNELLLTGTDLDERRTRSALDAALLTDAELALGRDGWRTVPDPLLGGVDPR
ncbi:GTP-binding protein [Streptomyces noursei]|uniref:GTP-binding protein n=1 Tax=Streptomyces noursei TaxID=1971 RepID=UPI001678B0A4|nr:GTP-binding protein [Streptomyces noursei]MCZ1014165.1 GTP-binding protein [Streptomyces noursei]